jgi:hypothetical protein
MNNSRQISNQNFHPTGTLILSRKLHALSHAVLFDYDKSGLEHFY